MGRSTADETIVPEGGSTAGGLRQALPALTVIWHPDLERVGERAILAPLLRGEPVAVSRLSPRFARAATSGVIVDESAGRDLEALQLSRSPAFELLPKPRGQIELRPAGTSVEVQGVPAEAPMTFAPAEIEAGVLIAVGRWVAFCLHMVDLPEARAGGLGLIGSGQALERVRADVRRVADLDVPVLIRGETGTGKELIARSIVSSSRRANKPFIAVNMATIPAAMAAAELFGHDRGAFTGAATTRAGFFGEAAGGTLFLDEVGLTPPDVQAMLLRVLETGEVMPLGSGKTRKVDVRVLAATDLQLETAIAKGSFSEPLFQRLAGFQVRLPALRKRREDFGELLLHFLRQELALTGEPDRLHTSPDGKPWLSAAQVARLAAGRWSGNVRALRNAARQIVIASRGEARAQIGEAVDELADGVAEPALATAIRRETPRAAAVPPPPQARATVDDDEAATTSPTGDEMPWEVSNDELLATLRRHNWSPTATAAALKIPRTKLYLLMDRHPGIRKASEVPAGDLLRAHRELGGDLDKMADHLCVSRRGLQLRMAQLLTARGA
ncbi:MAG TPA: sigma 54-interacting transcriptional regulator [Polyangia bacterium]